MRVYSLLPAVLRLFHGGGRARRLDRHATHDDRDVDRLPQLHAEPVPLSALQRRLSSEVPPHARVRLVAAAQARRGLFGADEKRYVASTFAQNVLATGKNTILLIQPHCSVVVICPIAIAYIAWCRLENRFSSVSGCIRLRALSRSHFLIDFHQNWHRRKNP